MPVRRSRYRAGARQCGSCAVKTRQPSNSTERIRTLGGRVVSVTQGAALEMTGDAYFVDPARADLIGQLFGDLTARFPDRHLNVVDAWPMEQRIDDGADVDTVSAHVRVAGESALHLAQACAALGNRVRLAILTRHAQPNDGDDAGLQLAQAPLWGFARAVELEHPELQCCMIDLPDGEVDIEALFGALNRVDTGDRQLALADGRRRVRRLVRSAASRTSAPASRAVIRSDSAYLITGGLNGLGLVRSPGGLSSVGLARWCWPAGARRTPKRRQRSRRCGIAG